MPYYHYTLTQKHICPKCQKTLERNEHIIDGNDGCIRWLAYIVCFPITLIILLIRHFILKKRKPIGKTVVGNTVVECPKCKSKVVYIKDGTRLLMTESGILDIIMPSINLIEKYNIKYGKVRKDDNNCEEVLELEFTNTDNDKKCKMAIAMGYHKPIIFENNIFNKIKTFKTKTLDIMECLQHPEQFKPFYDYVRQHYYSHELLVTIVLQELL